MITAGKIFAANIAKIYYRVSDDNFVVDSKSLPIALTIKCKVLRVEQSVSIDENNVIHSIGDHFIPKFDKTSIERCRKIGVTLVDKKYSGPLDRYINGMTGVPIKSPPESNGEAKVKKPKYHYLRNYKIGIPIKEFAEEDIPALDAAFGILFGVVQIKIESPEKIAQDYFEDQLKWCGTCRKHIEKFEIAHGLARKHHKDKSDTDPENLYRTCFDCNRSMIDEHILHYQHKLDTDRKTKYLANDPKSRLGNRVMDDMNQIYKRLVDLGIEIDQMNVYNDPLDVYKKLVIKEGMATILKQCINDDYVVVHKKDISKIKPGQRNQSNSSKCIIM
jgi:hypothetical protein